MIDRIAVVSDPEVMSGTPCIAGTRIPAETILANLRAGHGLKAIFEAYPSIPNGGIEAAIGWAEDNGFAWRPRDFGSHPVR